jgi:protein-S-isoprenylcysteine O-methyltransferase Ste14
MGTDRDAIGRRLPALGPRGEGWFAIQVVLGLAVFVSGRAGPALDGPARTLSAVVGLHLIAAGVLLGWPAVFRQRGQFTAMPRPVSGARLVTEGPYRQVRHPMYGGLVLAAIGWAALSASPPTCVLALATFVFFDLKSRREEVWLAERFPEYDRYRKHTRRFIPSVY